MHAVLFVVVFGLFLIRPLSFILSHFPKSFVCLFVFCFLLLLLFKIGDVLVVTCRYFSNVLCFDKMTSALV